MYHCNLLSVGIHSTASLFHQFPLKRHVGIDPVEHQIILTNIKPDRFVSLSIRQTCSCVPFIIMILVRLWVRNPTRMGKIVHLRVVHFSLSQASSRMFARGEEVDGPLFFFLLFLVNGDRCCTFLFFPFFCSDD